jgi:hypothetical protein
MQKAYHLWVGIKEFGKDGKKQLKEKKTPQTYNQSIHQIHWTWIS